MKKIFTPPYRVGKKMGRAILDSKGLEVAIFSEGAEDQAEIFCKRLNRRTNAPPQKIYLHDMATGQVALEFKSIPFAEKELGFTKGALKYSVKNKIPYLGKWYFSTDGVFDVRERKTNPTFRPVFVFSADGDFLCKCDSIREAELLHEIPVGTMKNNIRTRGIYKKKYFFSFTEVFNPNIRQPTQQQSKLNP